MNNHETAEKLISEAHLLQEEMDRAYEGRHWNLVVRRAQEIVELCLKGLLKALGAEYPRRHDVGDAFAEAVTAKCPDVDHRILEQLRVISSYLARDRAPAFYMEQEFTQEQAEQAKADAQFVLAFTDDLAKRLRSGTHA